MTVSDFSQRIGSLLAEVGRTNPEREMGLRSAVDAVRSAQSINSEAVVAALEGIKKSFSPQFRTSQPRLVADLTKAIDDEVVRIREQGKKRLREEEGAREVERTGEPLSKVLCSVERTCFAEKPAAVEKVSEQPEEQPISPMAILDSHVLRMITENTSDADRWNVLWALSRHPQTEWMRRNALLVDLDYCRNLFSDPELQELLLKVFGIGGRLPAVPERNTLAAMDTKSFDDHFRPFEDFAKRLKYEWTRLPKWVRDKFFDDPLHFQTLIENPALCKEVLRAIRSYNLLCLAALTGPWPSSTHLHDYQEEATLTFDKGRDEFISEAEKMAQYIESNKEKIESFKAFSLPESRVRMTLLPLEVTRCHNLRGLSLTSQKLTSLPREIGQLSELSSLEAVNCQLTSMPDTIGQLSRLRFLDVRGNQLGSIPNTIGQLQELGYLYVHMNPLVSLPDTMGQLHRLRILHADAKDPPVSIPDEIWRREREGSLTIMCWPRSAK